MQYSADMECRLKKSGISKSTFCNRIRNGWQLDKALDTPSKYIFREYYISKNGEIIGKANNLRVAAKIINKNFLYQNPVTKNMLVGKIYRKGTATIRIDNDTYFVKIKG